METATIGINAKTLVYSPYLDWRILQDLIRYGMSKDPDAQFAVASYAFLHGHISDMNSMTLGALTLENGPFTADSIVGGHEDGALFEEFKRKNNFSLNIAIPDAPKGRILSLSSAAYMELATIWHEKYSAITHEYKIHAGRSYSGKDLHIEGFRLDDVALGFAKGNMSPKSALIELAGSDLTLELIEVAAYGKATDMLRSPDLTFEDLLILRKNEQVPLSYHTVPGMYVVCPCIDVAEKVKDHLKDLCLNNTNDTLDQEHIVDHIHILASETFGKLSLSEKGVYARVETTASSHMILTAALSNTQPPPHLVIERGLIVEIKYKNELLFIAHIPQEEFKQKS